MIISMFFKNDILASLVATRENNIDSMNDLMTTKIKTIVDRNSIVYRGLNEENKQNVKFENLEYMDIFSQRTLIKILQGTHALIYGDDRLLHIQQINYKFPLHISKTREHVYLGGYIMKKSIDKTIEENIKNA